MIGCIKVCFVIRYTDIMTLIRHKFERFIKEHCKICKGFVTLDDLHCAFLDFCTSEGETVEWVNDNVAMERDLTLKLSVEFGGTRKGTKGYVIVAGIQLVTYPC